MLTKVQKEKVVESIRQKFEQEKIAVFSRIYQIPIAKLNAFRRELKKLGAEMKIAKKTLFKRSLEGARIPLNPKDLQGEVGVIFGYEDQIETAKAVQRFNKENETFQILAGLLGKKLVSANDIVALARLPSQEQLRGMLVGVIASPIRNFINVLQTNQRNLVVVLNKIKVKK